MPGPKQNNNEFAIRLTDVRKTFRHRLGSSGSIKEMVLNALTPRPRKRLETAALDGINFEVKRGQTVGVIGRNGSGKSTLLKVIAGITRQTAGQVETHGEIGALTGLWSGFHPDLSGMENIFLSAALCGVQRREVFELLDDIQDFAGLDEFIYTPVKNYSSGMLVRLAFAIAVHFEPEILLLDEILACGDRYFQNKALRRIQDIKRRGATIFFVSHFTDQIEAIADRVIWLERGRVRADGPTREVIAEFAGAEADVFAKRPNPVFSIKGASLSNSQRIGSGQAYIERVRLLDPAGRETSRLPEGTPLRVEFTINTRETCPAIDFLVLATHESGMPIGFSQSSHSGFMLRDHAGPARVQLDMAPLLAEGLHLLTCALLPADSRNYSQFYDMCIRFMKFWIEREPPRKNHALCNLPFRVAWRGAENAATGAEPPRQEKNDSPSGE